MWNPTDNDIEELLQKIVENFGSLYNYLLMCPLLAENERYPK